MYIQIRVSIFKSILSNDLGFVGVPPTYTLVPTSSYEAYFLSSGSQLQWTKMTQEY